MGEYAIRKSDGARIKIGTCENMYYIRFDQRELVKHESGNVDLMDDKEAAECRFRLPFPDELDMQPGEFEDYNRYQRLYEDKPLGNSEFMDESTADEPGTIQLRHECGLLVNVPCYHGNKLPDVGNCQVFWNGKSYSLVLSSLRGVLQNGELALYPVVRCKHCGQAWRYEWEKIWSYIPTTMRILLAKYKEQAEKVTA